MSGQLGLDGHCDHCSKDCRGLGGMWSHASAATHPEAFMTWNDGNCPVCAERERIVTWMFKQCRGQTAGVAAAYEVAAKTIEQGRHLRGRR